MISELLPQEKRRLHELEQQLLELERGSITIHPSDIYVGLKEMTFRLDELDKLVLKEPKNRKDDFRRRVHHLRTTYNHIKNSLDGLVRRKDSVSFDSQKKDLFAGAGTGGDIELEMAESGSLQRSSNMLSEYLSVGQETLSELLEQKGRLKSIQRKALDIMNYLGVSNTIIKAVERRDITDKWIVIIGMVLILLLIGFIWFFLRRR